MRRALSDVVTVAAGGMTFNNVIFDRGNDKTRMGTHVAQALGIEPAITNRSIMMADGRTKPLKGKSGHIDFYVKGIGGRKGMGLCIVRNVRLSPWIRLVLPYQSQGW